MFLMPMKPGSHRCRFAKIEDTAMAMAYCLVIFHEIIFRHHIAAGKMKNNIGLH